MYIYVCICICNCREGVKYGINFTSVRLNANKIAGGKAVIFATHPNTSEVIFHVDK